MPSRSDIKDSEEDDEERGTDEQADERDEDAEADEEEEGHEEEEGGERRSRRTPKAAKRSGRSRWQHAKAWFRDTRVFIYTAFFAGSFILVLLGFMSVWAPKLFGAGLETWFKSLGSYNTYLFFVGLICILTAGYLFLGLMSKRSEFKRLVLTKSKADFVHSLDRIERLAFELGSQENEVVAARKREFKIRH